MNANIARDPGAVVSLLDEAPRTGEAQLTEHVLKGGKSHDQRLRAS